MTAEIAIYNRLGLALAADSAVTIGRERVHKMSSKLFSLAPHNDIAIMVFGSGELCGYPWDTVIKAFRGVIGKKVYDKVSDCARDFITHIKNGGFEPDYKNEGLNYLFIIHILRDLSEKTKEHKTKSEFLKLINSEIDRRNKDLDNVKDLDQFCNLQDFTNYYATDIKKWCEDKSIFDRKISKDLHRKIVKHLYKQLSKEILSPYYSGLVFAGYGKNEYFPVVERHAVDGKGKFGLRHWVQDCEDANEPDNEKVAIIPFAQTDIATLFMEGIFPNQLQFIFRSLDALLANKSDELVKTYVKDPKVASVERLRQRRENIAAVTSFMDEFKKFRYQIHVSKILEVVEHLPKEELADMARAIIDLTSLRRKVDSKLETVGGPVDVVIISKGDGLVWINRKTYFDPMLNRAYIERRFGSTVGLEV
jgi:hypothetical protein